MKLNLRFVFSSILAVGAAVGVLVFAVSGVGSALAENTAVNLSKTLLTIPNYAGRGAPDRDVALVGAKWVEGNFVISSYCSADGNNRGLWIFSESGAQVAARNTCLDAGEGPNGSLSHTWGVTSNVQPLGNGQFVKEMGPYNDRPPLLYRVSGGDLISKAWTAPGDGGRRGNGTDVTDNIAAIPRYAVVVENGIDNVLYGLPNWNVIQRVSKTFIPITGVGNYFVGTPAPGNSGLVLYKVANNALQFVNKVNTNIRPVAAAVDPSSNGARVGFLFINDGGTGKNHVDIYTVGESGLSFSKKITLPSTATFSSTGWQGDLAINGDYTAFLDCGLSNLRAPGGNGDNATAARCGLGVLNGSTAMTVQRLPFTMTPDGTEITSPAIRGIAMSPNGTIAVTNMYGAYLYQIGGAPLPPDGDPDTFPPSGGDPGLTPQVPGQMLEVTFGATSTVPSILARFATFISTGANNFAMSIFGQNYTVDTSKAKIVRSDWKAGSISDFTSGSYVNVFGSMDMTDASLIHAQTVRNPLVGNNMSNLSAPRSTTSPFGGMTGTAGGGLTTGTTGTPTNTTLQNKLNALQESLRALQLRMNAR